MTCFCDKSLSEYIMVYVEDPSLYVNHDFVREHGVFVDFAERTHPLLRQHKHKEVRTVYAYTIAEVFRLIEFEHGNKKREPLHKILNEDRDEVHKCLMGDETITIASLHQSLMEDFLKRYDNAGLAGAS